MPDTSRTNRRIADGPDAPVHRLGHHVVGLLEAARESGDPGLIAQAEAAALTVGYILARNLPKDIADDSD